MVNLLTQTTKSDIIPSGKHNNHTVKANVNWCHLQNDGDNGSSELRKRKNIHNNGVNKFSLGRQSAKKFGSSDECAHRRRHEGRLKKERKKRRRQSDQHWNCFTGNAGETYYARRGKAHRGFSEHLDTALNGTEMKRWPQG